MKEDCKWVRFSLRQLCREMAKLEYHVSPMTIGRLLEENDYSLRANVKSKDPGSNHPERNSQFEQSMLNSCDFPDLATPIRTDRWA